jgi:type IV secretory pathway VirJ component
MASATDRFTLTQGRRLLVLSLWLWLFAGPVSADVTEETLTSDIGTLRLVHPDGASKGLVLFLPGATGWDADAVATAREVADQGHLVAGIDWPDLVKRQLTPPWWDLGAVFSRLRHWIEALWSGQDIATAPSACWDLSGDLARVADWVDEHETLPRDTLPILLGQAEGGALVYAALLQAPPDSFHATVSLGFCPRWPAAAPICQPGGQAAELIQGDRLLPAAQVPNAWFLFDAGDHPALRPGAGQTCLADRPADFIKSIANARMAVAGPSPSPNPPPDDGEALSPLASLFQWLDPRIPDQVGVVSTQGETAGLPLVEVRAPQDDPTTFAIMLSGDGGWAALDRAVSARLAERGISTVGWDSLGYFWKPRSPAEASRDLARVMRHYLSAWHKEQVILIGFSFGAEVLPFMANGLSDNLRPRVELAALLSVGRTALFHFHLSDWLEVGRGKDALPELPQVQALDWTRRLCVYGEEDDQSLCPDLVGTGVEVRKMPGDHHFNEDYAGVADLVLGQRSVMGAAAESSTAPPGAPF